MITAVPLQRDEPASQAEQPALPRAAARAAIGHAEVVVANLAKRYPQRGGGTPVRVFQDIGFTIPRGGATALIGANGAGKSTLLRCLVRLIEPSEGQIELLGEPVARLSAARLRRLRSRVGFVFQRHNLVQRLSVLTNVVHGAQGRHAGPGAWHQALAPRFLREEAMDCLARVGLADVAQRRADQLSGGQSQRVAIARMLMQRPRLVLADEPVASLDPKAGEAVMELLVELLRGEGITLLFTTHNVQHALGHADRVLGLANGHLTLDTPTAALDRERVLTLYG